jgi:hypothetical protein
MGMNQKLNDDAASAGLKAQRLPCNQTIHGPGVVTANEPIGGRIG